MAICERTESVFVHGNHRRFMYTSFVGEVFIVSDGYICIPTRVGINNGDIVWRAGVG